MPLPIPPLRAQSIDADIQGMFWNVRRGIIAYAVRSQASMRLLWPNDKEPAWFPDAEKWKQEVDRRYAEWQKIPAVRASPKSRRGGVRRGQPQGRLGDGIAGACGATGGPSTATGLGAPDSPNISPTSEADGGEGNASAAGDAESGAAAAVATEPLVLERSSPSKKSGWIEAARRFSKASQGAEPTRRSDENAPPLSVEEEVLSRNILEEIGARKAGSSAASQKPLGEGAKAGHEEAAARGVTDAEKAQVLTEMQRPSTTPTATAASSRRQKPQPMFSASSDLRHDFAILLNAYTENLRKLDEAELLARVEAAGRKEAERALREKVVLLDKTETERAEYVRKFTRNNAQLCKERLQRFWIAQEFLRFQEKFEKLEVSERNSGHQAREKELLLQKIVKKKAVIEAENERIVEDYGLRKKGARERGTQTDLLWLQNQTPGGAALTWSTSSNNLVATPNTRPGSAAGHRGFGGSRSPEKQPQSASKQLGAARELPSSQLTHADIVHFLCKILFSFVRENNLRMVKEAVTYLNDINHRDKFGDTLLTVCCKEGKPDLLRYFLAIPQKWGGDALLAKEVNEGCVLSFATQANFASDVIQKLLAARGDPNYKRPIPVKSKFGSEQENKANKVEAPLVYAVANNNEKVVKVLLVAGANPNFCYATSALRWAVRSDNAGMVNLLIRADADVISEERALLREADSDRLRSFLTKTVAAEKQRLGHVLEKIVNG
mmetsp:Transcript_23875/g.60293  ORF Transcript_23875/g.60293 Transcript_23875/m.60293 type:complete len:724 (+) Transcript_23875:1374-3545(+)